MGMMICHCHHRATTGMPRVRCVENEARQVVMGKQDTNETETRRAIVLLEEQIDWQLYCDGGSCTLMAVAVPRWWQLWQRSTMAAACWLRHGIAWREVAVAAAAQRGHPWLWHDACARAARIPLFFYGLYVC